MPVIYTTGERNRCITYGMLPGEGVEDFRGGPANLAIAARDRVDLYHDYSEEGNQERADFLMDEAQALLEKFGMTKSAGRLLGAALENVSGIAVIFRTLYLKGDPLRPGWRPRTWVDFQDRRIRDMEKIAYLPTRGKIGIVPLY